MQQHWRWALALAACTLGSTAAMAQPVYNWSGVYLGINGGYALGHSNPFATYTGDPNNNAVPAALSDLKSSSGTFGVQAGYNAQFGRVVLGGELDFNWLRAKTGTTVDQFWTTDPNTNYSELSSQYDWLSTARLRVGVLAMPDLLVYGTGGLAMTQVRDGFTHVYPTFPSTAVWGETRLLFGVALGGGIEYAITPNWSVKAEYLHSWFGDVLPQWASPGVVAGSLVAYQHSLDIVRAGVNYRWGAPSAAPHTPAPRGSWTGFYAGVNVGYVAGRSDPFATGDTQCAQSECMAQLPGLRSGGFIGGGQAGYNWQTGSLVFGAELDFSGLRASAQASVSPLFIGYGDTGTFASRYDWLFTARLRGGVAVTPDVLVYATGGLAVTHVTDSFTESNIPYLGFDPYYSEVTLKGSKTLFGAVIGGGIEYAVSRNWSVKAEYLHASFNKTWPTADILDVFPPISFNHSLDIARVGVNYRFD